MNKPFASETEMCARFIGAIGDDWTAYPETQGWDILLSRKADGFQIGIEAKLKFNSHVLTQALETRYQPASSGPDCRAVLVPSSQAHGFGMICAYIGIVVIGVRPESDLRRQVFSPQLPKLKSSPYFVEHDWHEWAPAKRHVLPEYVPDVAAGKPSPLQLTDWKIRALKLCVLLDKRGYLTRADFKHLQVDHRRWLTPGQMWLSRTEQGYVRGPYFPNFKQQHPRVYAEIEADFKKWKPVELLNVMD